MTNAISRLLTIVVPTRDRPDLLERCLQSLFERQERVPHVIVSDNSTQDLPEMASLQSKYPFIYVRQSGNLSMVEHHNVCMRLPTSPWALLLHDDDELSTNVIGRLEPFLNTCDSAGLVVGGTECIDENGKSHSVWIPETNGTLDGEAGVLRLGLDFRAYPPSCVWNTAAFSHVGEFPDAKGAGADFTVCLRLAYAYGVTFFPNIIGRYRIGAQQATDYSTPERAEATLDISIEMAQMTRTIGVSPVVADQLVDYMTWWIFRIIAASMLESRPFFVSRLCRKCMLVTPPGGTWRTRVRSEYPFLFWRPQIVAMSFFKARRWIPKPVKKRLLNLAPALVSGVTSLQKLPVRMIKSLLPAAGRRMATRGLGLARRIKARARLGVGLEPLSYLWGFDRGLPVHRYYLEQFLREFGRDIRGHCLEFQNPGYANRFGGSAVKSLDILHVDDTNPLATIVADLTKPNTIPSDQFDCIVCTHVLHIIAELDKAVSELHRILKPGGVLLVSVPHISMCDPAFHEIWRFTPEGLNLVLAKSFGSAVTVRAYGNSLTAAAELRGLVASEFDQATLNYHDPRFAVEICARAYKSTIHVNEAVKRVAGTA
jgi:SAM-dependent methyltransferase/glycosyltransferase involved in cell wall biosynthesis